MKKINTKLLDTGNIKEETKNTTPKENKKLSDREDIKISEKYIEYGEQIEKLSSKQQINEWLKNVKQQYDNKEISYNEFTDLYNKSKMKLQEIKKDKEETNQSDKKEEVKEEKTEQSR